MTFHWRELLLIIIAYGIGSIPFGYLIVQVKKGFDVRSVGSGNIGATNVLRTVGRSGAFLTLFLDGAKGFLVVWIADSWTGHNPVAIGLSAVAVLLGHIFPVFLRFRGGKGVATALGIFLYIGADSDTLDPWNILCGSVDFTIYLSGVDCRCGSFPNPIFLHAI